MPTSLAVCALSLLTAKNDRVAGCLALAVPRNVQMLCNLLCHDEDDRPGGQEGSPLGILKVPVAAESGASAVVKIGPAHTL